MKGVVYNNREVRRIYYKFGSERSEIIVLSHMSDEQVKLFTVINSTCSQISSYFIIVKKRHDYFSQYFQLDEFYIRTSFFIAFRL